MEEEEPEESGSNGKSRQAPKIALVKKLQDAGGSGSEKITSSSENEVEEIPKDEDAPLKHSSSSEDKEGDKEKLRVTNLNLNRSHTFDSSSGSPHSASPQAPVLMRSPGLFLVSRSPQSSSSQEEYEPTDGRIIFKKKSQLRNSSSISATTSNVSHQVTARSMESLRATSSRHYLNPDDRYAEDSKSLESLVPPGASTTVVSSSCPKTQYRSFLSTSRLDVRKIANIESKSSENLHREESLNAEFRRGLFAGYDRSKLQNLSLPPPNNYISLTSPGGSDRRITILSPHSPSQPTDFHHHFFSHHSGKIKKKKGHVLPRLVLPRSESAIFK